MLFDGPGGAGCATVAGLVTLGVSALAIGNLVSLPLLSLPGGASILWLGLVALSLWSLTQDQGVTAALRSLLSCFGSVHFVEVAEGRLRHGFGLLGREFTLQALPGSALASLSWSTGQASSMVGEDMDDWSVVLWFRFDERSGPPASWGREELWLLGPQQAKSKADELGLRLVAFLRRQGVGLRREAERSFAVAPREGARRAS